MEDMFIGGIYFGEKTIWDEIEENIIKSGLWDNHKKITEMAQKIDLMSVFSKMDKSETDQAELIEVLLNCKNVLEDKVRELTSENEELKTEIERHDEEIGRKDNEISFLLEFKKELRARCSNLAMHFFDNGIFDGLKICTIGEKKDCNCENLKKQIDGQEAEIQDLKTENIKISARSENLKKLLETSINDYEKLKEKYETADLEREHLEKENFRLHKLMKELNDRHQQDCLDLDKKQTTINELVDSYSELRRMNGTSE